MKEFSDSKTGRLLLLYFTFARIAAFVLGGGLAMLPVIEEVFVTKRKILSRDELLEMTALSQTVPGIVAANCACYVGMKIAGYAGAVAAVAGAVTPSFFIILTIAMYFPGLNPTHPVWLGVFAGVRAAMTALIIATAVRMTKKTASAAFETVFCMIFLILLLAKVNPAWVILSSMPLGIAVYILRQKRSRLS